MKRKLDIARSRKVSDFPVLEIKQVEQVDAIKSVKESVDSLWELLNEKEEYDFNILKSQLEALAEKLDFTPILASLESLNHKQTEARPPTTVQGLSKLIKAVEDNKPIPVDLSKLEKAIINVEQRIQESIVEPSQASEDFQPVRRVIKVGNKLVYDDQPTPSRGGGGGSSSSGGGSTSSVTVTESVLPTGASTSAKQDTQQTALDAIKTAVEIIDNAVSGSEFQVDVLTMPTVAVTGTFWQATQPVSGTFWQATQPVSLAATVTTKETRSGTPTQTSVNDTASSTTLIASNANRLGATVFNDSTVVLYLKLGATASTTSFSIKLDPSDYYEIPFGYTGVVDGIWASDASGAARITELTA